MAASSMPTGLLADVRRQVGKPSCAAPEESHAPIVLLAAVGREGPAG